MLRSFALTRSTGAAQNSLRFQFSVGTRQRLPVRLDVLQSRLIRTSAGLPQSTGLYRADYEKDSCGVGLLAHMKGKPSHKIVVDANEMLARMAHRGGCGCEKNTGDGAGILLALPDEFMRTVAASEAGISSLPAAGNYGVGNVFFSHDAAAQEQSREIFEKRAEEYGMKVLGWRKVPTSNLDLGKSALASEPYTEQIFVSNTSNLESDVFERELMRIRKLAASDVERAGIKDFYVCSLSSRTITYKGQLTPEQLPGYYGDLTHPGFETHMAMVHSRFSTNTFPSWDRAQPNRMLCHNGEINTLRGNKNWMQARTGIMDSPYFTGKSEQLLPICSDDMTDSGNFDSVLELLTRGSERSVPEAIMMLIPEAWQNNPKISANKRAFFEYNSCLMEPWDGPAMMAFTDGRYLGACLDRNGLRPSRYYVTKDDHVILSSEVGVLPDLDPATVAIRARLEPGRMFLVDFEKGELINDKELKEQVAASRPYGEWVKKNTISIEDIAQASTSKAPSTGAGSLDTANELQLRKQLHAFGYTTETMDLLLAPMAMTGKEGLGSMGVDTPLAALSRNPKLPFEYFKQLFAQVTNPPIDPIREEIVMSLSCPVGPEANLLEVTEDHARRMIVAHPCLTEEEMHAIKSLTKDNAYRGSWSTTVIDATFPANSGGAGMKAALDSICEQAVEAIQSGSPLIVLTHKGVSESQAPIPSLMVTGAVHHHLIQNKLRTQAGLFVEAGDAREVHDFSMLLGYGADGITPYVAFDALRHMNAQGRLRPQGSTESLPDETVLSNYRNALGKGILKVMSKMGISTLQSYKGAQIFEAVGLADEIVDRCFVGTTSRIAGAGFDTVATDMSMFHERAYPAHGPVPLLSNPGDYHYRHGGEAHYNTPESMSEVQVAARNFDKEAWKRYHEYSVKASQASSIRGLLGFIVDEERRVPLEEVEPVENIMKRFCTGAMSLGSISAESHEALAIAMNRLGARSNTGEGGEDPVRFHPLSNGDSKRSAIKQVASGRFGVTSNYLANSDQIQIKMAQGAKPGEGGELPGHKVTEEIARVRGTTPGVGLISPPPHHDIYSIEDLAQLIHDLKNSNPNGNVSVKLVSEVGVGIVAAGVAKAFADHITISGGDGGTGAAAWTGIHRAGLPWELGLAETQQTLVLNNLRSRIRLQTDGQLKNGRDVVIAALLGAEEFAFSTTPLIALGCIMMRKCHLNTCPVGIATQDPELRAKFNGQPEHVVNYFTMLAEEIRDYMSMLGFRNMDDMIGRVDKLEVRPERLHRRSKDLDLSPILSPATELNHEAGVRHTMTQDHSLELALDHKLIAGAKEALEKKTPVHLEFDVNNLNRTVGTMLSYNVSKRYGEAGLEDGTIHIKLNGSAGQSLGFTLAKGITIELEGDANDYVGKGLSGGHIVVYPQHVMQDDGFVAENNVIVGNVCLYGATSGKAFFRGLAGERFAVRNSGARAVVEGVGDHGCEYMTGGRVVVLGSTGRNFAAGMSGGIAFVYNKDGAFQDDCNMEMVAVESVGVDQEEELRLMIEDHLRATGSPVARSVLANWNDELQNFSMVMPHDYRLALERNKAKAAKEAALSDLGSKSVGGATL